MTKRGEKTTSVRLPDDVIDFMIRRFGSLRGACIALVYLQQLIDDDIKKSITNDGKYRRKS